MKEAYPCFAFEALTQCCETSWTNSCNETLFAANCRTASMEEASDTRNVSKMLARTMSSSLTFRLSWSIALPVNTQSTRAERHLTQGWLPLHCEIFSLRSALDKELTIIPWPCEGDSCHMRAGRIWDCDASIWCPLRLGV